MSSDHPTPNLPSLPETGPQPADRKADPPPVAEAKLAEATRPSGCMSEDNPSERTRTPALEAKRKTKRQATSAVAHVAPEPAADDPLLSFAPYLHKTPRANSITPTLQRRFIASLAATGIVTQAALSIGKSMEALYKLRNKPGAEGFAAAWDAALERGVQRLEGTALARAIEGVPEWKTTPDGGIITYGTKHNEALVMFFLRNRRPERYSEHIRPGHPVYERIRSEVLASIAPGRSPAGEEDGGEDTQECVLSRHLAQRLAQEGGLGQAQPQTKRIS